MSKHIKARLSDNESTLERKFTKKHIALSRRQARARKISEHEAGFDMMDVYRVSRSTSIKL